METNKMKEVFSRIEMPADMKKQVIENCYAEIEGRNSSMKQLFRKPAFALPVLVLCLSLVGFTTVAAAGKLSGFFKDITNPFGTVTGTEYLDASDEIEIAAECNSDVITVEWIFVNPDAAPYNELDSIAISNWRIEDSQGKEVMKNSETKTVDIVNGKATLTLSFDSLPEGEYVLIVDELTGYKKADSPLKIGGYWMISFEK